MGCHFDTSVCWNIFLGLFLIPGACLPPAPLTIPDWRSKLTLFRDFSFQSR